VAPKATVVANPVDAAYPAAWAVDLDPSRPSKLAAKQGWWDFTYAAPQRVDAVAVIHHNLQPGGPLFIQGSNDGFATVPIASGIVVPAYRADGYPVSPWLDLTVLPGYTTTGFTTWRIAYYGADNPTPPAVGEIVMVSHLRSLDRNPQWGFAETENHPLIEHATDLGVVTVYEYGTLTRTYTGQIIASEAGATELRALARDARFRSRGWLFIPDAAVNEAWFVRWLGMPQSRTHQITDANPMAFSVEEISRGLPL